MRRRCRCPGRCRRPTLPALEAVARGVARTRRGRSSTLTALAQLLFFSAGLTKRKVYPGGETIHFRAAASTGALYQTEVYVVAGRRRRTRAGRLPLLSRGLHAAPPPRGRSPRGARGGDGPGRSRRGRAGHRHPHGDPLAEHLEVPGAGVPALLLGRGHAAGEPPRDRGGDRRPGPGAPRVRGSPGERPPRHRRGPGGQSRPGAARPRRRAGPAEPPAPRRSALPSVPLSPREEEYPLVHAAYAASALPDGGGGACLARRAPGDRPPRGPPPRRASRPGLSARRSSAGDRPASSGGTRSRAPSSRRSWTPRCDRCRSISAGATRSSRRTS